MKRGLIVLALLLAFGAAKLPFEHQLTAEHRTARFHGAKLDLSLRAQLGQGAFVAALSGFRSLVADFLWITAHVAWERQEWGRMALLLDQVTALQPRCVLFWDMAGWHMAWNASIAALENRRQPRQALRIKAAREFILLGKDFLERGIQNNPDRYELYAALGTLYRDKLKDPCAAARQFEKAAQFPEAPLYLARFAAYMMAECPGREREAYERLVKEARKGPEYRAPTLEKLLHELEEKLAVPPEKRIYIPPPRPEPGS